MRLLRDRRRQRPGSIVYDDADLLAFLDIRPVTPGHLLVTPKRHAPFLADLDEATGARMFTVAMRLAAAVRASGLRCEGINLFLADGEAAFQEVFHTHFHVIPRFVGDTFRVDADWSASPSRADLDDIAAQVRAVMPHRWGREILIARSSGRASARRQSAEAMTRC